jgi:Transposase zinc-ribbon domain
MSKSTISTFQLFEMFPTPESARLYLESRLWPDGAFCPECKSRERIGKQPKVGFYRCNACSLDFTIRTGTIFERSHIPLHKWLYAMYLLVTARKGISSLHVRGLGRLILKVVSNSFLDKDSKSQDKDGAPKESK